MSNTTQGQTVMIQGRIVWTSGDLFAGQVKKDHQTKQPKLDQQGQPVKEYGFGLAVDKQSLQATGPGEAGHIWAAIHAEAQQLYPSGQVPPSFAWKYKDGDGVDHNGQPFSNREGHAGHLIFALTTMIPIKFFKYENEQNIQVNEGIKCGDYVKVQVQVKAHGPVGQGKPGLYINPLAVQFLGYGQEIVNSPSGDQIFGQAAPQAPQGASATPLDPAPGAQIVPTTAPPAAAAPAPHHGVLPQQFQQQAPAPQPAMPPAAAPVLQQAPAPQPAMPPAAAPVPAPQPAAAAPVPGMPVPRQH